LTKTPSPLIQPLLELRRGRPLAIAHRGASASATENTLGAFRKAHSLGADLWEVDAALTGDGTCVACHDEEPHCIDGKDPQPGLPGFF
jgi:glycerophosphoryl diester phosphodiesterase